MADRDRPSRQGQPLTDHTGSVESLAFSPDGKTLATASIDQTVNLWDLDTIVELRGHLVKRGCAIAGQGLTREEWASFLPGEAYQDTCARERLI